MQAQENQIYMGKQKKIHFNKRLDLNNLHNPVLWTNKVAKINYKGKTSL